jgi:hypothetical protein
MEYEIDLYNIGIDIDDNYIKGYVGENFDPDDVFDWETLRKQVARVHLIGEVFSDEEILSYVRENFKSEEVFDESGQAISDMKDYIQNTYSPKEVYSHQVLSQWAIQNGFIEFDDQSGGK